MPDKQTANLNDPGTLDDNHIVNRRNHKGKLTVVLPPNAAIQTLRAKLNLLECSINAAQRATLINKMEKCEIVTQSAMEVTRQLIHVVEQLDLRIRGGA